MCLKNPARTALLSYLGRLLRPALHRHICQQEFEFCRDVVSGVTDGKLTIHMDEETLPLALREQGPVVYLSSGPAGLVSNSRAKDELRSFAQSQGLAGDLRDRFVTASWEAATNAVKYAAGGSMRICASATNIQVWVCDIGPGIALADIPHATLRAGYSTGGTAGLGYTLMISAAHHLDLLTSTRGTVLVLTWDREAAEDPRITELLGKYSSAS